MLAKSFDESIQLFKQTELLTSFILLNNAENAHRRVHQVQEQPKDSAQQEAERWNRTFPFSSQLPPFFSD